ncbi:LOW QUALITY PROTEIN: centrosomal protein of 83 kDa-like [Lethenteron reissneri]|uniref:LOW QUALITY PROTEIN: centrosomal protein of 83 kDa-like n=1 Tax=Lethenteron reissneri TaxID=7753 RepID=UPI002AB71018|nr:LOW QUALITY PROTEIN: centrosomal protein of 83 kDa-like [Lethenteron reissneri]
MESSLPTELPGAGVDFVPRATPLRSAELLGLGASSLLCPETEMQKMLMDERMRCEHHKTNYRTLKEEHTRLQDESLRTQAELKRVVTDKQSLQERFQLMVTELRGELLDKTREIEELRSQVPTPQRLELLKAQIQQELELPMRERLRRQEEEAERYRGEFNKLRYEQTVLKSEFEHQRAEHGRVLEEMLLKHQAQLSELENEKATLQSRLSGGEAAAEARRAEALLRERAQLLQRVRGLQTELEELQAQRGNSGLQADNVQRMQSRQIAESQANVRALEAEGQSLKLQVERLEEELRLSQEQCLQLSKKQNRAEREASSLNNKLEEMKHAHKLEMTNLRVDAGRARAELERERDGARGQLDLAQGDLEAAREGLERQAAALAEKEQEMMRRVQAARSEGFQKLSVAQEQVVETEAQVAELERVAVEREASWQSERELLEETARVARTAEEGLRRDGATLKAKVQQLTAKLEAMQKEQQQTADLQQEVEGLRTRVSQLAVSERELQASGARLREVAERHREDARRAQDEAERVQGQAQRSLEEERLDWLQEKHKLDAKLCRAKEKLNRIVLAHKKRKQLAEKQQKVVVDELRLLEATKEQLEAERNAIKSGAPFDEHRRLRLKFRDLQRRHEEFRRILVPSASLPLPGTSAVGAGVGLSWLPPHSTFIDLQEDQHQRELVLLKRRVEDMEQTQRLQLEELVSAAGPHS